MKSLLTIIFFFFYSTTKFSGMLGVMGVRNSGDEPEEIVGPEFSVSNGPPPCLSNDHSVRVESNSPAAKAMRFMEKGEYHDALHLLNLCLDSQGNSMEESLRGGILGSATDAWNGSTQNTSVNGVIPDEIQLLERRCLVMMRLRFYDKVPIDADRILKKDPQNSVAFKCLIAALCKLNKVNECGSAILTF